MKAKTLAWLAQQWELIRVYKKPLLAVVTVLVIAVLSYRKQTKELRETKARVEKIQEHILFLENAQINLTAQMEVLQMKEIIIIEKYQNEKLKIHRIPSADLQYWADSLYNGW